MVIVPAGSFNMGSPVTESGRKLTEAPQHTVTVAKPFAVSKFAVTFAEWDACAAQSLVASGLPVTTAGDAIDNQ
jgi:formylglycine-generating enzyme required for sulfatase activity